MKSVGVKIAIAVVVLGVIGTGIYVKHHRSSATVPEQIVLPDEHGYTPTPSPSATGTPTATPTPTPSGTVPDKYGLAIPFTAQAPTGNWDELHNEACEEASSIMAAAYFSGDKRATLPAAEVEKKIADLTKWQDDNQGYHLDSTAEETAKMIKAVYGLNAAIVPNFTEDMLKKEVSSGHVVILPVNGQIIGNPYYTQPGPIYHMLVVRGYSGDKIITNDSGTKRGESYSYNFSTLQKAGANWDHSTNTIDQTKKLMIVVSK